MKRYSVILELLDGYHGINTEDGSEILDYESPKIKKAFIDVEAENETDAIEKAIAKNVSKLSVYNAYVSNK